jgi:hypothetical protein
MGEKNTVADLLVAIVPTSCNLLRTRSIPTALIGNIF